MIHVEGGNNRRRDRLGHAGLGFLIEPITSLDIVLRRRRRNTARSCGAVRRNAKSLEEVVRGPVFLDYEYNVLKIRYLSMSGDGTRQREQGVSW